MDEMTVPFRITVRGGGFEGLLLVTASGLAVLCKDAGIPIKLRAGDGVFETFARNAGRCYCHAELGPEKDELYALQQEYPREDPDSPMRLWGVVQDRFDLVRAMCDTDGLVLFPPEQDQVPEFLYMLAELARRKDAVPVALVGWTRKQVKLLEAVFSTSSALMLHRFGGHRVAEVLGFLRQSQAFLVRTARQEEAVA